MFDVFDDLRDAINPNYSGPIARYDTYGKISAVIINFMMAISFSISITMLVFAIIMLITSAGDRDNMEKARKAVFYCVIAAFVSFFLIAAKRILVGMVGVNAPHITNDVPGF